MTDLPLFDPDAAAQLRRWVADGVDLFRRLGGGEAALDRCRGSLPRGFDQLLEHLEVMAHAAEGTCGKDGAKTRMTGRAA